MLTINDLASIKQLGTCDMAAVRGGSNINAFNANFASAGGFASPSTVVAPVTQVDASSSTASNLLQNLGGFQLVGIR